MKDFIEILTKMVGVALVGYTTARYGPGAAIMMLVFGCAMTVYTCSEQIENWWRHRGEE